MTSTEWNAAIDAALAKVREQRAVFSSDAYATPQPIGGFMERFACNSIEVEIEALRKPDTPPTPAADANPFVGTNWQVRADTPTPAAEEREAVARAICALHCTECGYTFKCDDGWREVLPDADAALLALAPIRAAEILAAEARGAERERARKGTVTTYKRERDALRDALQGMVRGCDYSHFSDAQLAAEAERYPSDWIDLITDARAALTAPVPGDMREVVARLEAALTTIAGSHWERFGMDQTDIEDVPDLSAEEAMNVARDALSYDNDQAAALTPHIATGEREAVARAMACEDLGYLTPFMQSNWLERADRAISALAPRRAAEILAAEANERARIMAWIGRHKAETCPGHHPDKQGIDLVNHGYGNALVNCRAAIERNTAALTANHSATVVEE